MIDEDRLFRVTEILNAYQERLRRLDGFKPTVRGAHILATNAPSSHYDVSGDWRLSGASELVTDNANAFQFHVYWEIRLLTNRDTKRSCGMVDVEPSVTAVRGVPSGTVPQKRYAQGLLALATFLDSWKNTDFHELVGLINEPVRVRLINTHADLAFPVSALYDEPTQPWL